MKIVLINTFDRKGGAGIACYRLMEALRKSGNSVKMLVREKQDNDPDVVDTGNSWLRRKLNFLNFLWERFIIWIYNGFSRKNLFAVSLADTGIDVSEHPLVQEADIIHLHWINQGFLSLKTVEKLVRLNKPVVWTMHDMWPCTGICHHAGECDQFTRECGNCFYLRYPSSHDLSVKVWKRKNFLNDSGIYFVMVSRWLQNQVKRSSLTNRVETCVIPNVLDLNLFYFRRETKLRQELKIREGKKVMVFGAVKIDAPLKGLDLLKQVLQELSREEVWRKELIIVIFGDMNGKVEEVLSGIDCEIIYLGPVADPGKLAELYSIADVTVVPSRYETFGQVIIESMACGTPVVCFDNSGQRDIISHLQDGYLAIPDSVTDFAKGVKWLLEEADYLKVAARAVDKVKRCYSEEVIARQYVEFYRQILK